MLDRLLLVIELAGLIAVVLTVTSLAIYTLRDIREQAIEEDEGARAELVRRASAHRAAR